MTKVLTATCEKGVVKVNGLPVPGAVILSEGVGASEGFVAIDLERAYYLARVTPDLATTLEKLIESLDTNAEALNKLVDIITSIGAGMTGPSTAPPPDLATDLLEVTQFSLDLTGISSELESLKEALR